LRMMSCDAVSDMLKDDPNLLKHEQIDDAIVLTASTEQLQKFMVEYANVKDVFGEAMDMKRLEPVYTDDDLIFDANLTGQWEGKGGEMLDVVKMSGKTYDLIYVEADGTEHQCYANLARVKDVTLMSVFLDKSELDPNDPYAYAFHLIPDVLFKVERREPELVLQHLEHEDVVELRQDDPASREQDATNACYFFEGIRTKL
jgi:hypothetical protein